MIWSNKYYRNVGIISNNNCENTLVFVAKDFKLFGDSSDTQ